MKTIFTLFMILFFSSLSWGQSSFIPYNQLIIKDLEEMQGFVRQRQLAAQEHLASDYESQAVEELREGLKVILSRPDADNLIAKVIGPLRSDLRQLRAFDDALSSLANEALKGIKNDSLPVQMRCNYVILIDNLMSFLRPNLQQSPEVKEIFTTVYEAKVQIPRDVRNTFRLNGGYRPSDLSKTAGEVLKNTDFSAEEQANVSI